MGAVYLDSLKLEWPKSMSGRWRSTIDEVRSSDKYEGKVLLKVTSIDMRIFGPNTPVFFNANQSWNSDQWRALPQAKTLREYEDEEQQKLQYEHQSSHYERSNTLSMMDPIKSSSSIGATSLNGSSHLVTSIFACDESGVSYAIHTTGFFPWLHLDIQLIPKNNHHSATTKVGVISSSSSKRNEKHDHDSIISEILQRYSRRRECDKVVAGGTNISASTSTTSRPIWCDRIIKFEKHWMKHTFGFLPASRECPRAPRQYPLWRIYVDAVDPVPMVNELITILQKENTHKDFFVRASIQDQTKIGTDIKFMQHTGISPNSWIAIPLSDLQEMAPSCIAEYASSSRTQSSSSSSEMFRPYGFSTSTQVELYCETDRIVRIDEDEDNSKDNDDEQSHLFAPLTCMSWSANPLEVSKSGKQRAQLDDDSWEWRGSTSNSPIGSISCHVWQSGNSGTAASSSQNGIEHFYSFEVDAEVADLKRPIIITSFGDNIRYWVIAVATEAECILSLRDLILETSPDILLSTNSSRQSWSWLFSRASFSLGGSDGNKSPIEYSFVGKPPPQTSTSTSLSANNPRNNSSKHSSPPGAQYQYCILHPGGDDSSSSSSFSPPSTACIDPSNSSHHLPNNQPASHNHTPPPRILLKPKNNSDRWPLLSSRPGSFPYLNCPTQRCSWWQNMSRFVFERTPILRRIPDSKGKRRNVDSMYFDFGGMVDVDLSLLEMTNGNGKLDNYGLKSLIYASGAFNSSEIDKIENQLSRMSPLDHISLCTYRLSLLCKIAEKANKISFVCELGRSNWMNCNQIIRFGQQKRYINAIAVEGHRQGYMIEAYNPFEKDFGPKSPLGAHVFETKTGAYICPVLEGDFASYFTSILMMNNMCMTTLMLPFDEQSPNLDAIEIATSGHFSSSSSSNRKQSTHSQEMHCFKDMYGELDASIIPPQRQVLIPQSSPETWFYNPTHNERHFETRPSKAPFFDQLITQNVDEHSCHFLMRKEYDIPVSQQNYSWLCVDTSSPSFVPLSYSLSGIILAKTTQTRSNTKRKQAKLKANPFLWDSKIGDWKSDDARRIFTLLSITEKAQKLKGNAHYGNLNGDGILKCAPALGAVTMTARTVIQSSSKIIQKWPCESLDEVLYAKLKAEASRALNLEYKHPLQKFCSKSLEIGVNHTSAPNEFGIAIVAGDSDSLFFTLLCILPEREDSLELSERQIKLAMEAGRSICFWMNEYYFKRYLQLPIITMGEGNDGGGSSVQLAFQHVFTRFVAPTQKKQYAALKWNSPTSSEIVYKGMYLKQDVANIVHDAGKAAMIALIEFRFDQIFSDAQKSVSTAMDNLASAMLLKKDLLNALTTDNNLHCSRIGEFVKALEPFARRETVKRCITSSYITNTKSSSHSAVAQSSASTHSTFPNAVMIGDKFKYIHLPHQGPKSTSLELISDEQYISEGEKRYIQWVSPNTHSRRFINVILPHIKGYLSLLPDIDYYIQSAFKAVQDVQNIASFSGLSIPDSASTNDNEEIAAAVSKYQPNFTSRLTTYWDSKVRQS